MRDQTDITDLVRAWPSSTAGPSRRCAQLFWAAWVALFSHIPLLTNDVHGQTIDMARAYRVKAAFVYAFLRDVTWPDTSSLRPGAPIVIGVFGESPILENLQVAQQRAKAKGRPFELRVFEKLDDIRPCHILVISESVEPEVEQTATRRLLGTHTLIVSERPQLLSNGAALAFEYVEDRVQMVIDLTVARREELQFAPQLLAIARVLGQAHVVHTEAASGP